MNNVEAYKLEKPVWTQNDFERMGWHDARVWGMLANTEEWEFLVDLDYIFECVHPTGDEKYFKFWVAPVTMVFENAYDVKLDIESQQGQIEIADLHMENPRETRNGKGTEYTFHFECHEGEIVLTATGYKLYVRKKPVLLQSQNIGYAARGGVNFGRELNAL